jgi:ATP-binding cassette subfamily F protein 3
VGVVGPNGAGKSTIFELLTGRLEPDKGDVSAPAGMRIGHVRQQLNPHRTDVTLLEYVGDAIPELHPIRREMTAIEHRLAELDAASREKQLSRLGELQTQFEHLGGYELKVRAEVTLSGLGFSEASFAQPFRSFSGGWQIRAELARNLVSRPDILLLDEPTNYLDVPAVEWLRDYLRQFQGTLLLISHDRYLLNSLTSVTLEVMGAQVTRYPGAYAEYVRQREARHEQLLAAKRNQDRKREQLERFVERFRAKNTKASQAQSRMKMLEKMEEIDVPRVAVKPPKIRLPAPPRCGAEVLRLEEAGLSYDGNRFVFRNIDMRIERGDKAAIVGLNGMGKTTLLRVLAGRLALTAGRRVLGHNVALGYQSQDFTDVMDPAKTVYETARAAAVERSDSDVRDLLGGFGFSGPSIDKHVSVLSGGEKVRLALARLLLKPCNVLLLDEPTTHLDIYAREALEDALREYGGTLCLVSHDVDFVRHLANTVYAMTPGGIRRYYGGYDYYREKLAEESGSVSPAPAHGNEAGASGGPSQDRRAQRREDAQLRQEFARRRRPIEKRMAAAEREIEGLEEERDALHKVLVEAGPGTDFAVVNRRLSEIESRLEELTAEWERDGLALEELAERIYGGRDD